MDRDQVGSVVPQRATISSGSPSSFTSFRRRRQPTAGGRGQIGVLIVRVGRRKSKLCGCRGTKKPRYIVFRHRRVLSSGNWTGSPSRSAGRESFPGVRTAIRFPRRNKDRLVRYRARSGRHVVGNDQRLTGRRGSVSKLGARSSREEQRGVMDKRGGSLVSNGVIVVLFGRGKQVFKPPGRRFKGSDIGLVNVSRRPLIRFAWSVTYEVGWL